MRIVERSVVLSDLSSLRNLQRKMGSCNDETIIRFVVEKVLKNKLFCSTNLIVDVPPGYSTLSMDFSGKKSLRLARIYAVHGDPCCRSQMTGISQLIVATCEKLDIDVGG